jgi:hypothetical protein
VGGDDGLRLFKSCQLSAISCQQLHWVAGPGKGGQSATG